MMENIETYRCVENWYEPEKILKVLENPETMVSEMSYEDHGFLCGIIKRAKPKKIVEIGVAEGGTTAVIMNAAKLLGLDVKMVSVDLNEQLYWNRRLKTGYLYDILEKSGFVKGEHTFLFGKTIAGQIEKIRGGIDLVILDTTHMIPGELLDFLCVLPYVKEGAFIVLHDVQLNSLRSYDSDINIVLDSASIMCTRTLLGTATGEKYFNMETGQFPNIAAVRVNKDTYKYVSDVFWMLGMTWKHMLPDKIIREYRDCMKEHYSEDCMRLFDMAVTNNRTMCRNIQVAGELKRGMEISRRNPGALKGILKSMGMKKLAIYGLGKMGRDIYEILKEANFPVCCGIDRQVEVCQDLKVYKNYMDVPDDIGILIAFREEGNEELIREIKEKRHCLLLRELMKEIQ